MFLTVLLNNSPTTAQCLFGLMQGEFFAAFFYLNAKLFVESWWWSRQEQRLLLSPLEEPWVMAAAGTAAVNCIARRQLFS